MMSQRSAGRPPWPCRCSARILNGPPVGYNLRAETAAFIPIVEKNYPQLLDLVQDGSLVVCRRPASYVERRSDGYVEPELIFLIGTAHISRKSAMDVERVIQAVRPCATVVELCKSRSAVMWSGSVEGCEADDLDMSDRRQSLPNVMNITGDGSRTGFITAMQRSMQLGGQSALVLRILLSNLANVAADQLGVKGGAEFIAARLESEKLGSQLVLGDRPIEITLERAWEAMSWKRKLQLCWELLMASLTQRSDREALLTEDLLESMKRDDAISVFFKELSHRYPELPGPLIHERDMYLAWSLKRSKAVNGSKAVVGVMGRGHLRGVMWAMTQHDSDITPLRFTDLVGGKNNKEKRKKEAEQGLAKFAVETAIFMALYFMWNALNGLTGP